MHIGYTIGSKTVEIWIETYLNPRHSPDRIPVGGVTVHLYVNDKELGVVTSQNDGKTVPISYEQPRDGSMIIEAAMGEPPVCRDQSRMGFRTGSYIGTGHYTGPTRFEKIERHQGAQRTMSNQMAKISEYRDRLLINLSEVFALEEHIETDFMERAFAPFWDGICDFAVRMGHLEEKMRFIADEYRHSEYVYKQYLTHVLCELVCCYRPQGEQSHATQGFSKTVSGQFDGRHDVTTGIGLGVEKES